MVIFGVSIVLVYQINHWVFLSSLQFLKKRKEMGISLDQKLDLLILSVFWVFIYLFIYFLKLTCHIPHWIGEKPNRRVLKLLGPLNGQYLYN